MTDGQKNFPPKTFPPPCPMCSGATELKELRRSHRPNGYTCFFKCQACGVEYPHFVDEVMVEGTGLLTMPLPTKHKPDSMSEV